MCKILEFCFLPKGFVEMRPRSYIARARHGLPELSDRAQPMQTKGFLMSSATEHAIAFAYKRSFIAGT
jgi:hypothetical protein